MDQPHAQIARLEEHNDALQREVDRLGARLRDALSALDAAARAVADWEALFDALPDSVSVIDTDHRLVRINRAMAERFQLTRETAPGRPCYELLHRVGAPPAFCPHALALEDGRPHGAEVYEPALDAFFLITASPLKDAAGRVVASVHIVRELGDGQADYRAPISGKIVRSR